MSGITNIRPYISSMATLRQTPKVSVSVRPLDNNPPTAFTKDTSPTSSANPKTPLSKEAAARAQSSKTTSKAPNHLTEAEQKMVQELQQRDAEVRIHEQAHIAASGGYALGGPSYDFQTGPDGRNYAVGGHVKLDTSRESTPEATIQKAAVLRRAALAPADPSGADRAVAAAATRTEQSARKEQLAEEQKKKEQKAGGESSLLGIKKYSEMKNIMKTTQDMGETFNQQA